MQTMDVQGFKCQRTILQLQLESIPQIFFQIYLLFRIEQLQAQGDKFSINVSPNTVVFSLITAIFHVILEFFKIYLESTTSETKLLRYLVACYSARQGWVPLENKFRCRHGLEESPIEQRVGQQIRGAKQVVKSKSLLDKSFFQAIGHQCEVIDFENQFTVVCGQGFS